ncbi:uncharacterized protein LOC126562788 [Anopheles maculipalpis]|uniref:uncharacterized protein LOC126562788 n=1 Tax=Anopheles maculipalpis TaxID=1496333 RepID=UPI002158C76C|nr:uncharacterized protein LOC126562788 [Anopheles maculipalpis]
MKCDVLISLLYVVFALIRPGFGEGIEKVSYLLQYGPGVHTVFEQESSPDKVTVNVKDRGASSTELPSTLTSNVTSSESHNVSDSTVPVLSASTLEVTQNLHSNTPVTESVSNIPDTVTTVTVGSNTTEKKGDASSKTPSNDSIIPQPSKLSITSEDKKHPTGSMPGGPDDERQRIQATAPCHTPVSVLQKVHPLPLPPALPTFGAILRSDVMVNLKPKELRTLMSTYIGLIETYKSFNQQQKRNIAHLEEELARHELIKARADRLRNTKVEILNK